MSNRTEYHNRISNISTISLEGSLFLSRCVSSSIQIYYLSEWTFILMFLLRYLKLYYDIQAYLTNKKITNMMCKFIYKFVNMLMLLPLSLLVKAAIQALSLMLNAYLVVETSRINPAGFCESVALSRETCNIGCTSRERVPLGTSS